MIPVFLCPDNSGQTDDEKDMILQYKGWCNAYKQNSKNRTDRLFLIETFEAVNYLINLLFTLIDH